MLTILQSGLKDFQGLEDIIVLESGTSKLAFHSADPAQVLPTHLVTDCGVVGFFISRTAVSQLSKFK